MSGQNSTICELTYFSTDLKSLETSELSVASHENHPVSRQHQVDLQQ